MGNPGYSIKGEFTANGFPNNLKHTRGVLSMARAMEETERRRTKQDAFNKEHGIVPQTVVKSVRELIDLSGGKESKDFDFDEKQLTKPQRLELIAKLEQQMREAAKLLEFEYAAELRDRIIRLQGK